MNRRRLVPLCTVAIAGLLAAGSTAGAAAPAPVQAPSGGPVPTLAGPNGIIDDESFMEDVDCDMAQLTGPAATSTGHLTGDEKVSLDALVLVDVAQGAKIARIKDKKQRAAAERALFADMRNRLMVGTQSYEPLDITLKYDDFALLKQPAERTDNAEEIIALAKKQLGGKRPADVDVVYVLTDLDIQLPSIGKGVAGLADCIGGVALADRAFAVGETKPKSEEEIPIGPLTFYKDMTAKIASHEIGHLMGGHHHYQECGKPAPVAAGRGEPGPCTIMTNFVDFQTLPFSTVNSVVVRGHAEKWATANDR